MLLYSLNPAEKKLFITKSILSILFGLLCIGSVFMETENFILLAYGLGAVALLNGTFTILFLIYTRVSRCNITLFRSEGTLSLVIGILILLYPQLAIGLFMRVLGCLIGFMGMMQIILAFDLTNYRIREILLIYSGVLSILLGVILFRNPDSISSFVNVLLGGFFVVTGGYGCHFAYQALTKAPSGPANQTIHVAKPQPKKIILPKKVTGLQP